MTGTKVEEPTLVFVYLYKGNLKELKFRNHKKAILIHEEKLALLTRKLTPFVIQYGTIQDRGEEPYKVKLVLVRHTYKPSPPFYVLLSNETIPHRIRGDFLTLIDIDDEIDVSR